VVSVSGPSEYWQNVMSCLQKVSIEHTPVLIYLITFMINLQTITLKAIVIAFLRIRHSYELIFFRYRGSPFCHRGFATLYISIKFSLKILKKIIVIL
jgi:hypothetical protein